MAQSMTARYVAVISLLAILSTAAYFSVQQLIETQEDNAHLVSVSGNQLLHSQHIAAAAVTLAQSEDPAELNEAEEQMRRSVDMMRSAHGLLTSSRGPVADLFNRSATLQRLYRERPFQLDMKVRKYLQDADNLLAATTPHERTAFMRSLIALSQGNMPEGLAKAVKEYQTEVNARLKTLQNVRLGFLAAIYLLLALDGLIVFRPLLNALRSGETERDELRRELEETASHDPLTHVLNRRMFNELLAKEISQAKRHGTPLSLVLLDMEHLGRINREHGTETGDRLLEELAQMLVNNVRTSDYVFRYDGSRFAVLAPGTPDQGCKELTSKLDSLIRSNKFHNGLRCAAFCGAGLLQADEDIAAYLARVEEALQQAKAGGCIQVDA
ncbi:MAG: GGDEF domain-containing protein [Desulfovibrionaceae bacterium]